MDKDTKERIIAVSGISAFVIIALVIGFSGIDFSRIMIDFTQSTYTSIGNIGIYLAVFLISIFGNFTVFLPMPYLIVIATIIVVLPVNLLLVGLFAGLGAAIGELSSWLIGRGASELLSKREEKEIGSLKKLIEQGYGFGLVLLFAATPLPDDILLIALGMTRYSLKKAIIASIIGKVIMALAVGLFIILAKATMIGQFVLGLYGLKIVGNTVESTENPLISTVSLIVTVVVMIALIKIDWPKLLKKKKTKP